MLPPSWDMLEERLRARRSDASEEIERRLKKAREEIKCFKEYEYVIINDVLERAVGDLGGSGLAGDALNTVLSFQCA